MKRAKTTFPTKSRSVELYNPSVYNGMFIRKFEVPLAYTRTNDTYPSHTPLYVTKSYLVKGNQQDMKIKNIITPLWNIPNIYPLQNRRLMLI